MLPEGELQPGFVEAATIESLCTSHPAKAVLSFGMLTSAEEYRTMSAVPSRSCGPGTTLTRDMVFAEVSASTVGEAMLPRLHAIYHRRHHTLGAEARDKNFAGFPAPLGLDLWNVLSPYR